MPSDYADAVAIINLKDQDQRVHVCNPRCDGELHFEIVFEFVNHVTEEQIMQTLSDVQVVSCKRIYEYPEVRSEYDDVPIGAHSITFIWR